MVVGDEEKSLCEITMNAHLVLSIFHALVIAPFLIYIGLQQSDTPDKVFTLLAILAAVIAVYHAYRAYTKIAEGKSAWINWIHLGLVVPLFVILAKNKKDTERRYFEMTLMLGFAALGYHGYYMVREFA